MAADTDKWPYEYSVEKEEADARLDARDRARQLEAAAEALRAVRELVPCGAMLDELEAERQMQLNRAAGMIPD